MIPPAASGTPFGSPSYDSLGGASDHRWSYPQSISNSSVHTTSITHDKDSVGLSSRDSLSLISSGPFRNQNTSVPNPKSRDSLEKSSLRLRNESQSSISTLRSKPDGYTTTPIPEQGIRFSSPPSVEDEEETSPPSTPRASLVNAFGLETDLIPSPISSPFPLVTSKPSILFLSDGDKAGLSESLTSPRPFKTNRVDPVDPGLPPIHAIVTAGPSTPSVPITSFSPPMADRVGIVTSRFRTSTVTPKRKKGMLGFMTDFLNPNKRPEITTPHDLVHLTHVGFNSSTGEFTGLPKEWKQLLQDIGISKSDQEKNPLAVMEIVKFYQEGGGDVWDKMGHAPAPGGSQLSPIPDTAQPAHPGVSKSVDDGIVPAVSLFLHPSSGALADSSKRPSLSPPKKVHSSGGPQSLSSSHVPASYRPMPPPAQPVQPNLDRSTSHRTAPKPPRNDTLVRSNTTRDRRSPAPRAAVKAPVRESSNTSTPDLPSKSQSTTAVITSVAESRAPPPPTAPQQQRAGMASLANYAGVTTRRREKKEDKPDDADIVKRLQQICTDADPTRLYRNLVQSGQG